MARRPIPGKRNSQLQALPGTADNESVRNRSARNTPPRDAGRKKPPATKGAANMSFVRNVPIARKFTYAFGIICLLCVALAGYTFFTLRGISASAHEIGSDGVPSLVNLA